MEKKLREIASAFALEGRVMAIDSLGEGFINDTFIVRTGAGTPDYILQRKNKRVFPDVPAMMDNIRRVTDHIRRGVIAAGGDPQREVMTVVAAKDGRLYHIDSEGEYWAVTVFIDDTIAYDKASSPELARKGGEGIGKFQSQLAGFTEPLAQTIEGFHNIRHRFVQWDDAMERDAADRKKHLAEEIGWIESRRAEMLDFWSKVEDGTIPTRVTHNDTKINNILFDKRGEVLCVIDLDTVMASTSLNDFGDAIRSYANTGDEDDRDLSRVGVSLEMFAAYTDGYLSQRATQLTDVEIDHLAFSSRYIAFEQVLRFLMDYIDGDTYYKIKYPDHNLVRTQAQYRLLRSMEQHYDEMCGIVMKTVEKHRKA
ncbi:aminoglycoside phosphotransferase family protein [uncultured Alistipes sp.]|uniref:phosphotransferase enzyme family protein n=1 Tax=uncultured Alistipes sp. TaxID=538949 RepID=UPI0025F71A4C|nr:aminoglycoside phosphotransferase family protein [uncultured Alistipes sp.]